MNNFFDKFATKLAPVANAVGSNIYLMAIRDAFMLSFPLTMFGSVLLVINNFPLFNDTIKGQLSGWLGHAVNSSMLLMSLFVAFGLGYNLYKYKNPDKKDEASYAGAISLTSFLIMTPFSITTEAGEVIGGVIPTDLLGAKGLFVAMIIAILAANIYSYIVKKDWTIKLPEGVPPTVGKSFAAVIPGGLTLLIFTLASILFTYTPWETIHTLVYEVLQQPLVALGTSFPATLIAVFLVQFFWFFGIHGHLVVNPIMDAFWNTTSLENLNAYNAGQELPHIITKQFVETFTVAIGSMGALAALVAIFIVSKNKAHKEVAKLGLAPAVFNIAEPTLFGLPIIMNPIFAIPWMLGAPICLTMAYFATLLNLVPKTTGVSVPWTMPLPIGGFLATNSIAGSILQLAQIGVLILLWIPFIKAASNQAEADIEVVEAE